ncbi:MAG: peptidylprolyl isomerase [candidate division Zixibacteria bacterium]|nr:peptidylprolyl isomerase [candidate division Zixibacteria bacterium]
MKNPLVLMQTNFGDITIEVYEKEVPIHAGNFLKLVDESFYDSLTFHRIVPNFVIQGGDPDGTGMGGAPGKLADDPSSPYKHDRATIAMARGRTDASTSQFYINLKENYGLDRQGFLIFAKVIDGMDVVDKIAAVKRDNMDKPLEPVIMTKVARLETKKDIGEKSDK